VFREVEDENKRHRIVYPRPERVKLSFWGGKRDRGHTEVKGLNSVELEERSADKGTRSSERTPEMKRRREGRNASQWISSTSGEYQIPIKAERVRARKGRLRRVSE